MGMDAGASKPVSSSGGSTTKKASSAPPSSTKKSSSASAPAKKNPTDSANISKGAKKADKPNAMAEGIKKNWTEKGLEANDGNKLGKYTKGGEGTVEKELLKKGFSLKEIYTKDKQGRTLADQVAQTNGIKDQKKIADGKELTLPQRPGAKGISSSEVKEGEKKSVEVQNGPNTAQQSVAKDDKGNITTNQNTAAGTNNAQVETKTGPGGLSIGSVAKDGKEVVNNNVTQSANNKAITETQQRTDAGNVNTTVRDADGVANSTAKRDGDKLNISNPDGANGGVDSSINLGPQSRSEKVGRFFDNLAPSWTGAQRTTGPEGPVDGVRQVDGTQRPDGSANYNIRQNNGQVQKVEQTGRGTFQNIGKGVSDTLDSIGSGISSGFNRLFGGSNPNGGIPAEQIFSPSGTII